MIHNQTASAVNLARSILFSMDYGKENQSLPTPTLELLLTTLIQMANDGNQTARKAETAAASFVAGRISGVEGR